MKGGPHPDDETLLYVLVRESDREARRITTLVWALIALSLAGACALACCGSAFDRPRAHDVGLTRGE